MKFETLTNKLANENFVFIFVLILRFLYVLNPLLDTQRAFAVYPDAWEYQTVGKNIAEGHGFSMRENPPYKPEMLITPVYPLWIALHYKLFDPPNPTVLLLLWNIVFSAITALFIFKLTCCLSNRIVAFLASVLWALEPNGNVYSAQIIAEPMTLMFLFVALYLGVCKVVRKGEANLSLMALIGLILGLATLAKPMAMVPSLILMCYMVIKRIKLERIALMFLSFAILVGLWVYRNWRTFGLAKLSSVTDMTLSIYHAATVKSAIESIPLDSAACQLYGSDDYERIANIYPDPHALARTGRTARRYILSHPFVYLRLWAVGEVMLWVTPMSLAEFARFLGHSPPTEPISYEVIDLVLHFKIVDAMKLIYSKRFAFMPPLGLAVFAFAGVYSILLVLFAFYGLLHRRTPIRWLLLSFIIFLTFPVGICPSPRYRTAAMPFVAILAAFGIVQSIRFLKRYMAE